MLTDKQAENISLLFYRRFRTVNQFYLEQIAKQLKSIGKLGTKGVHKLEQLARMNEVKIDTKIKLFDATAASLKELEKVYTEIAKKEYERYSSLSTAKAFKDNLLVQRTLAAQLKVTAGTMTNLANTTAKNLGYKSLLDNAIHSVSGGFIDYNQAIRHSVSQQVRKGLSYVEYDSGYTRRIDSAVRMNILEGVRQVGIATNSVIGKQVGADGVEISAHALCAEDHIDIQGKQFTNANFERMQSGQDFEDVEGTSYLGLDRAIGTLNCKHFAFKIVLGVSDTAHSKKELAQYQGLSEKKVDIDGIKKSRYDWTQKARQLETFSRDKSDLIEFYKKSGDALGETRTRSERERILSAYKKVTSQADITYRKDLLE